MEAFYSIHILLSLYAIVCDSRLSLGTYDASSGLLSPRARGKPGFFSPFTSGRDSDSANDGNDAKELSRARALEEFPEYSHKELNLVDTLDSPEPTTPPPYQWNSDRDLEIESIDSVNGIIGNVRELRSGPVFDGEEGEGESVEENSSRMGRSNSEEESNEGYESEEDSASWLLSQDVWDKMESDENDEASAGISDRRQESDEARDEEGNKPSDSVLMEKLLRFGRKAESWRFKREVGEEGSSAHPGGIGLEYGEEDQKAVGQKIHGRIDVSFVPPVNNPHALITIKSDSNSPLAAEAPPVTKVHRPFYFCSEKIDPNLSDPDSPDSVVFESKRVD